MNSQQSSQEDIDEFIKKRSVIKGTTKVIIKEDKNDGFSNLHSSNNEDAGKNIRLTAVEGTPGQSLLMRGNTVSANSKNDNKDSSIKDDSKKMELHEEITRNEVGARDDTEIEDGVFYATEGSLTVRLRKMKEQVNTALTTLINERS